MPKARRQSPDILYPSTREHYATVVYTPNAARLVGQHRPDRHPFIITEFIAHDSRPRLRSLNHGHRRIINPKWPQRGR